MNAFPLLNNQSGGNAIDLKEILHLLMSQRWLILASTLLMALVGVYKAQIAVPIYQVNALVQVEDSKGSGLGAMDQVGGLFQARASVNTEIELIKSRMVLGYAVDALNLDIGVAPRYFPFVGEIMARRYNGEAPAKLAWWQPAGYSWGGERSVVTRLESTGHLAGQAFTLRATEPGRFDLITGSGQLLSGGRVGEVTTWHPGGDLVSIFVRELSARKGTEFVVYRQDRPDAIAGVSGALSLVEISRGTGIIQLRFDDSDPARALRILNQVVNSYVRQNVERKSAEAQKTLEFLDGQLPQLKQQLEAAEIKFNEFRVRNNTLDVTKEGELLLEKTVEADTQLSLLQQRRRELLSRFTTEHPLIKNLDSQMAALQGKQSTVMGQVDRLPKVQQEFLRLTRDLKVSQELYGRLLDNAQQLRVARAGTVGNARVVDYAVPAKYPYRPDRTRIFMFYTFAGLLLGLAAGYLRLAMRNGVKDASQIEQQLSLSVLATVPESDIQDGLARQAKAGSGKIQVLAAHDAGDLAIESLRSLRTSLQFVMIDARNRILMLTGPAPGIGKSFLAVNLAAILADAGERVLVIDADLRRGHLHDYFGGEREGGLSELIAGRATPEQVCHDSGLANLDYVSTGTIPPNPSELLLHPRFVEFLEWASERYDRIMIDSPPILAVTDAAIIGRHVGTVLMVARFAVTPMKEIELASRRLQQAGVTVSGVVLNRVERTGGYSYGYKYQYAYQYRSRKD